MKMEIVAREEAQCERCGRCLHACPSYRHLGIETFSPRGRLDLIRARECGDLSPGPRFKESMDSCLQCLACSNVCPKGVESAQHIRWEKTWSIRKTSHPGRLLERIILKMILSNRHALYAVTALAARLQRLFMMGHASTARHLPLFLPEIIAGRKIPQISLKSFSSRFPDQMEPPSGIRPRGSVILYTGCFFGYADLGPASAAVRVLCENGFTVRIPHAQTCCGAPALMGGHPDIARKTAETNLISLEGTDPIITICATCGNALKNDYSEMLGEKSNYRYRPERLPGRVHDIIDFLQDLPDLRLGAIPVNRSFTIHDPCHLNHGMHVSQEMRDLLSRIPGLVLSEMEDAQVCCGGSGLGALKNTYLANKLGRSKAEAIAETGAHLAASPCPGCLLQIRDHLSRIASPVNAVHPVELLAMTFKSSG